MGDELHDRVRRVEEAAGFTEHTVDQLGEELAALRPRIEALAGRLTRLERRLAALEEAEQEPEEDEADA